MPDSLVDSHIHFSDHERLEELERYRSAIGARELCLLSLPLKQRINFNPEVLFAKAHLGSDCYGLASFDYSPLFHGRRAREGEGAAGVSGAGTLDLAGQVDGFRELGFDGLKIFLGKPSFQSQLGLRLDDPPLIEAFRRAESLGMPVLIHVADPLIFWSHRSVPGFVPPGWEQALADGGGIPSFEDLQQQALEVLRACPDLTVIFPHLLFLAQDLSRLAGILDAHPGAHLDLAPGLYFYHELDRQRDAAREFFARYRRRILFGTDAFWFPEWFSEFPRASVEDNLARGRCLLDFLEGEGEQDNPFVPTRRIRKTVRGLGLGAEIMRRIRTDNFRDLYPAAPRRIQADAALPYLEDFLERLRSVTEEAGILELAAQLKRRMEQLLRGGIR